MLPPSPIAAAGLRAGPATLFDMLEAAVRLHASDVHLTAGSPPLARVNGEIVELPGFEALGAETCRKLIYSALYDDQRERFERGLELDCALQVPRVSRFRMNVLQQRGVVEAVFRVIPSMIPSAEYLGLSAAMVALAEQPRGLVLVTGPTGSGKSTTLACLIEHINQTRRRHILTIEDPIEFVYARKRAVIRQREVGPDTRSYADALRHALRQDPDVLLIGELRDLESIALALTAAETGHLCLATLHTSDAAQTVDRIVDVFPPMQQQQVRVQLSSSLKGVISQTLLPRRDGRGRAAAREVMLVNPAIANLIREGKTQMIPSAIETGARQGMFTLERALTDLVKRGVVDPEEAAARSANPQKFLTGLGAVPV